MPSRRCVIGIGSAHGDDQVGWLIADEVRRQSGGKYLIHKVNSPLEILDRIDGVEWLGICDACQGATHVGDWKCWSWPDDAIVKQKFAGGHDIGLNATLDLLAGLDRIPRTVKIWGLEIAESVPGGDVSPLAMASVTKVAEAMIRELIVVGPVVLGTAISQDAEVINSDAQRL